ncbi:fimbrial protein [Shewanella frigidimarina]|uniref:fimbrial protein n=1 Tax=Shewanella frigidimarina TaxID=56812 RepID=UPI003179D073
MNKTCVFSMTLLGILFSVSIFADNINISITGEIHIPPCVINNNSPINLSFGQIANFKIDGQNYAQQTTVNVQCVGDDVTPYIKISGTQLGTLSNVLEIQTGANKGKLGIALYQGSGINHSNPLIIGTAGQSLYGYPLLQGLSASGQNRQFTFTSVPHSLGDNQLLVGEGFSASATMDIYYL